MAKLRYCFSLRQTLAAIVIVSAPITVIAQSPNSPTVNTATRSTVQDVRDVDNPARQAWQITKSGSFSTSTNNTCTSDITVPVGKQLVIENVSGVAGLP